MHRALLPPLLLLSACTTWQAVTYPAPSDPAFELKGHFRIIEVGGTMHYGKDAFGRGDYLVYSRFDGSPDSVARTRVRSVERGGTDDRGSFMLAGAIVGALVVLGIMIAGALSAPIT